WKFMADLVEYGPEYFWKFKDGLGEPEPVEQISLVKSQQIPVKAMDINESTTAGNIDALTNLFRQMGVGSTAEESSPGCQDIGDHVTLVHGDLSTAERVESLRQSRSDETTSWRRFQSVVFVMGLFHLKMACADAIWKLYIQPKAARLDETCMMEHVAEIRPKETIKMGSKPGFRRMHEVIQHVGVVSRLDCWRLEVERVHKCSSLEEWAKLSPTWEDVQQIAKALTLNYVAGNNLSNIRSQPQQERDKQNENSLLLQRDCLLYEEITHAMNAGDIG
ncbi:hypothetical protein CERSUDRAFT_23404, partial [Gelatoporia subvermispora B]